MMNSKKEKDSIKKICCKLFLAVGSIILLMSSSGCQSDVKQSENVSPSDKTEKTVTSSAEANEIFDIQRPNTENYKLKEVVILSRHNIRAPLSSNGSVNQIATPHEWFKWTGKSSELSLKGGVLETKMGQYFRKWLEDEELIPENYIPTENETRFYANSK